MSQQPAKEDTAKADMPTSFEEAYARLESIVRKLETGDTQLDEGLRLFEEGVALARLCTSLLDRAEARINKLVATESGDPAVEPFDKEAEAAS